MLRCCCFFKKNSSLFADGKFYVLSLDDISAEQASTLRRMRDVVGAALSDDALTKLLAHFAGDEMHAIRFESTSAHSSLCHVSSTWF